jgi:hypothetical protein
VRVNRTRAGKCHDGVREGVGKFMAENQGSDVDEESHSGPTDVHRMAYDTQQVLLTCSPQNITAQV